MKSSVRITNDFLQSIQNYDEMYGTEPQYYYNKP